MVSQAPAPGTSSIHEQIFGKRPAQKAIEIFGTTCLYLLKKLGPLDEGIVKLMKVPDKIYQVGEADSKSFSTNPKLELGPVIRSMNYDYSFPAEVPDYGLLVHTQGSTMYCTLLDSKRKVIVTADVCGIYSEEGEWSTFADRLKYAVTIAENMASRGEEFRFVVNNNGKIATF